MAANHRFHARKADRLLWPKATPEEVGCAYAVAPFDEAIRQMDAKWGVGRLPGLVSPETAARWGDRLAALNAAIAAHDPAAVTEIVGRLLRGIAAMDAEAESRNAPKADPRIIEYIADNGFRFAITRDADAWPAIAAAHPGLRLVSLQEVAVALQAAAPGFVDTVKAQFPGAQLTAIREKKPDGDLDDEIPF